MYVLAFEKLAQNKNSFESFETAYLFCVTLPKKTCPVVAHFALTKVAMLIHLSICLESGDIRGTPQQYFVSISGTELANVRT